MGELLFLFFNQTHSNSFLLECSCFTMYAMSSVQQCESAICIHISHSFWISFPCCLKTMVLKPYCSVELVGET